MASRIKQMGIVVECYLDTMIINALGYDPNSIHQGFGQVANIMKNYKGTKIVGIIDDDKPKNLSPYFTSKNPNLKLVEEDAENKLKFFELEKNKYLVKIVPAAEKWLIHCNNQLERPIAEPYDFKTLLTMSKSQKITKDPLILNYINTIKQKNPQAMLKLKNFLDAHFID